jgi:tight adherence protein B
VIADWLPALLIGGVVFVFLLVYRFSRTSGNNLGSQAASEPSVGLVLRNSEPNAGMFQELDDRFDKTVEVAQTGFDTRDSVLLILAVGVVIGVAYFVFVEELYGALASALVGAVIAWIGLVIRSAYVRSKVQEQFPTVADMLSGAIRAGVSVEHALASVAAKSQGFLGQELRTCAQRIKLGMPTSRALQDVADRYELLDLKLLAAAVAVNRQTGGNLSKVMEQLARVSRERQAYRRQIGGMTASARLAAFIVGAAAPALVVYYLIRGSGLSNFWEDSSGRFLMILAVCLEIAGVLWILAITRRDL